MSAITQTLKSGERFAVPLAITSLVVLITASIAVPNLWRSQMAAKQSARIASERLYAKAQRENQALTDSSVVSMPMAGQVTEKALAPEAAAPVAQDKVPAASADRKLVRTGSLELTVNSPADVAEQIRRLAESMGGYLESAQIGGTKDAPTADITIRVPATHFEDAKARIRGLAARVESEKTDATDVTRQYVDMQARLHNLRAEQVQCLTIMKSAFKVDDLLQVAEKLSEVRGEIEQQQAEFQTLRKQVETVAISISLRTLADTEVFGLNWRPLYQLKLGLRNGLAALGDYAATMAAILFYVPVILAWGLTILCAAVVGWRLFRWTARRFFAWPTAAGPQKAAESV